jgi:hydrogenase maturation protease
MSHRDHERAWYLLVSEPPDSVVVDGHVLTRGCRVRLAPTHRGDLFDLVLAGKTGRVESIDQDHEGKVHLAIVIDDDPGRDLGASRYLGHRFFFAASEVEPLDEVRALPSRRLLIAGIGNLFLGDDGFGVEVVRRLTDRLLPPGVEVADFGIRGMDLIYALGNGWQGAILVDTVSRGEPAGTLIVLEPEIPDAAEGTCEGHGMDPVAVLAAARRLGVMPEKALVIGCEPAFIPDVDGGEDLLTELSPEVEAAVERAVELATAFVEHGSFTSDAGAPEHEEVWAGPADGSYERAGGGEP